MSTKETNKNREKANTNNPTNATSWYNKNTHPDRLITLTF
jgi:hypothetical protein